jgi:tRNA-dihydrouridine synthase
LHLSINGGIADAWRRRGRNSMPGMDGVMIGRAAYHTPGRHPARRVLSEGAARPGAGLDVLDAALALVDAPEPVARAV